MCESKNIGAINDEETSPFLSDDVSAPLLTPQPIINNANANGAAANHEGEDQKESSSSVSTISTDGEFRFSTLTTRRKYILILCILSNLFVSCAFSILAPFFPQEAAKKGLSTTTTGFIFSIFELVNFIASPIYGNYMTRIGGRFMFTAGVLVGGCCSILFGVLDKCPSGSTFLAMCMAVRTLEALAFSGFITASLAFLSNEFPKHVATVIGIVETANGVGMMIGPALGGALYQLGGYSLPFFVLGGLFIVMGLVLLMLLPSNAQAVSHKRKGSVFKLFLSPLTLMSSMSIVSGALTFTFLDLTLAKHLEQQYESNTGIIGLIFGIAPFLYALFSPLWGYLVDSKNIVFCAIVAGHLFYGISFLWVGPSPWLPFLPSKLWVVILGLSLLGISIGCALMPNMKVLLSAAFSVGFEDNLDTYAVTSGLFNSLMCCGAFTGPILGGALVQSYGFEIGATVMGVINICVCIITGVCFSVIHLKNKKRKKEEESIAQRGGEGEDETTPLLSGGHSSSNSNSNNNGSFPALTEQHSSNSIANTVSA